MPWDQQSPINLAATVSGDAPKDYLRLAWSAANEGFLHDGDHGIEILFGVSPDHYVDLSGKRFVLRHFHFHHPSEHLIEGQQEDAELHVVHQNLEDCTLAVVGIMLSVDAEYKETKEALAIADSFRKARETKTPIPTRPSWWLPEERDRLFRYEGSLTTPPYTEAVSWIIFQETKSISSALFTAIFGEHPQKARAIQPLSRRYVLDLAVKLVMAK